MNKQDVSKRIYELKNTFTTNGFKLVSSVQNNYQTIFKKGKYVAIIDLEIEEEEYCVYIMKDYRYIYRKTIECDSDLKPMMQLAMCA